MVGVLGSASLLSASRAIYGNNGIGLSSSARALTNQFLNSGETLFGSFYSSMSNTHNQMNQIIANQLMERIEAQEAEGRTGLSDGLTDAIIGSLVDTEA